MSIRNIIKRNDLNLRCNEMTQKTTYDELKTVDFKVKGSSEIKYNLVYLSDDCFITRYRDLFTFNGSIIINITNATGNSLEVIVEIPIPEPFNAIQSTNPISGWCYIDSGVKHTNAFLTEINFQNLNEAVLKYTQMNGANFNFLTATQYRLEYCFRCQGVTI